MSGLSSISSQFSQVICSLATTHNLSILYNNIPHLIVDMELVNHQSCAVVTKKKQKDIGEDLKSVLWILMVKCMIHLVDDN